MVNHKYLRIKFMVLLNELKNRRLQIEIADDETEQNNGIVKIIWPKKCKTYA